jgi:hypothetical protein
LSDTTDLAYAAALIDGEGCISISKFQYKQTPSWSPLYRLSVIVAMTDRSVIEWMKEKFGGHVSEKLNVVGHKPQWRWIISSKAADNFLMRIYPFMVGKRNQANVAFLFRDTFPSVSPAKKELIGLRQALFNRMKTVKR